MEGKDALAERGEDGTMERKGMQIEEDEEEDESGFDAAVGDNTLVGISLEEKGDEDPAAPKWPSTQGLTYGIGAEHTINPWWAFATPNPSTVVDIDPNIFRRPYPPSSPA